MFVASTHLEALDLIRRRRRDVLVVGQSWLETDGLEPSSFIHVETPIVFLTAETMDEERTFDTESKICDQVAKPVDPCDVLTRVRAALRRSGKDAPGGPEETGHGDLVIDRRCHEVRVLGEAVHLTPTEFRLLEVMTRETCRAFTRFPATAPYSRRWRAGGARLSGFCFPWTGGGRGQAGGRVTTSVSRVHRRLMHWLLHEGTACSFIFDARSASSLTTTRSKTSKRPTRFTGLTGCLETETAVGQPLEPSVTREGGEQVVRSMLAERS